MPGPGKVSTEPPNKALFRKKAVSHKRTPAVTKLGNFKGGDVPVRQKFRNIKISVQKSY